MAATVTHESPQIDAPRLRAAYEAARRELLALREPEGHWVGRLSSSALSTATAVSALALVDSKRGREDARLLKLIVGGLRWLAERQNADGGWGDTDLSLSNIATTMLVKAAFHLTGVPAEQGDLLKRADRYIASRGGIPGLRRRYGKDKTFAIPILTNCALAGFVPWKEVSPLPFELACLPQHWFRFLRLPVVSYAIPALVGIGQARYHHRKPWNPLMRLIRRMSLGKSLRVLEEMQPESGGFLEATPLTSFVVMSLASIGQADHPVVRHGVEFLIVSAREDGSWPIDTNLATWNTTLSINALESGAGILPARADWQAGCLPHVEWLLSCQHREVHRYTGAAPGGWAWTDLSGGVPDVDDTSGALLALANCRRHAPRDEAHHAERDGYDDAAAAGVRWLLDLQNANGGWPTFCRGWGTMPFDRSATDLTAHALRALLAWRRPLLETPEVAAELIPRFGQAIERGFRFLAKSQRSDGSWVPLWFGNQHNPHEENPVYGTARVLLAYRDFGRLGTAEAQRGLGWLVDNQNVDGGWGGGENIEHRTSNIERRMSDERVNSSVEETALAVEALLSAADDKNTGGAVDDGLRWLVEAVERKQFTRCSPIGFYFAKLWYYEKLYPVIFSVSALGQAARRLAPQPRPEPPTARLTTLST